MCFVRGRSVQKKCQWHFFSVGRSGYAARGNHVGRIACGRELYEFFDSLMSPLFQKRGHFFFSDTLRQHRAFLQCRRCRTESAAGQNTARNCPFILFVWAKKLLKCRAFEQFIREKLVISAAPEDLEISGAFFSRDGLRRRALYAIVYM